MAATKTIHRSSSLGGSKSGFLIDRLQIVAPRKEMPVPNHLLETKIYSKVAQNSVVQARPAVVHFGGFELGKTMRQKLFLANVSSEVQRYHIIPPQTKFFNIKYAKNDRLVPGLTLDCVIEFYPDEYRYYYDCIRINCKGDDNLIIPVHAYPIMSRAEFPKQLDFPSVPVGERRVKKLPLLSHCPVDFEFSVTVPQHHPAFRVEPLQGNIPAMGETYITVTFSPSDFSTCQCTIQVNVSQFNAKPLMCVISGRSAPGLLKELSDSSQRESEETSNVLDPSCISPVDRCRRKKKVRRHRTTSGNNGPNEKATEVEKNGLKFPLNMNTPYAVSCVLNQEPGKLRARDIRDAQMGRDAEPSTRQMKEALFEQSVRQNVYEERQNQLRWQVRLGEEHISSRERMSVLEHREHSTQLYKTKRGDPNGGEECARSCTECKQHRIQRDYLQVASEGQTFDLYKNDPWAVKHDVLNKFTQAARTIIIRKRAEHKLGMLGVMVNDMDKRKHSTFHTSANLIQEKEGVAPEAEVELSLSTDKVTSVTFPTYKSPDAKDDMAPDAVNLLDVAPTVVTVKHKVPYYNLKVPEQYKLASYATCNVDQASRGHVAPGLARQLRTGAEDELINLPLPDNPVVEPEPATESTADEFVPFSEPDPASLPLNPPESLLQPVDYPPMHIFNPSPGLQVYQSDLPYSETETDFHLCPLPRYGQHKPPGAHKQYTDREDVIKGVMQWKKLPSQGLTSLSNTPTLTNVWVPRWTDGFVTDLLPEEGPAILDKLADDDRAEEESAVDAEQVLLTPEMVNAQFTLIDSDGGASSHETDKQKTEEFPYGSKLPPTNVPLSSTGPVPRDTRERELDHFLNQKYNRLGQKIHQKVNQINCAKTQRDLVLE